MQDDGGKGAEKAKTQPDAVATTSRKDKLFGALTLLRSTVLSTTLVLAALAVAIVVVRDLSRAPILVDEFGVPEALSKEGYTGLVASNMLWDAIEDVKNATGEKQKKTVRVQTASQQLDIVHPGSGLSLQRITKVLRSIFNLPQTRIAGEFVCLKSECRREDMSLRIRIFSGEGTRIIQVGRIGDQEMEEFFFEAALMVQDEIDPLAAARYYFAGTQEERQWAVQISTELLLERGQYSEEAATLLGEMALIEQEYEKALRLSDQAVEVGDEVRDLESFWSRGKRDHDQIRSATLLLKARTLAEDPARFDDSAAWERAIELFEEAAKLSPEDSFVPLTHAWAMQASGYYDEALILLQKAVDLNKLDPYLWSDLGRALLDENKAAEAENHFDIARSLAVYDPYLERYYATPKTIDEALADAKTWAQSEQDNLDAWYFWTDLLYEKSWKQPDGLCFESNGSVSELIALSAELAPQEIKVEAQNVAQDMCDWYP